ncbi:MAG: 2Fe-2S iron-sulfur cluster-binding protein [Planctomycetota bacterium]
MIVDGEEHRAEVDARTLLADFLREELGVARARIACADGGCRACAVLLDGKPVRSCTLLALQADGARVTTDGTAA